MAASTSDTPGVSPAVTRETLVQACLDIDAVKLRWRGESPFLDEVLDQADDGYYEDFVEADDGSAFSEPVKTYFWSSLHLANLLERFANEDRTTPVQKKLLRECAFNIIEIVNEFGYDVFGYPED